MNQFHLFCQEAKKTPGQIVEQKIEGLRFELKSFICDHDIKYELRHVSTTFHSRYGYTNKKKLVRHETIKYEPLNSFDIAFIGLYYIGNYYNYKM